MVIYIGTAHQIRVESSFQRIHQLVIGSCLLCSARIKEVEIQGHQNYLEAIASINGGQMEDAVVWGRIGKAKKVYISKDRGLCAPFQPIIPKVPFNTSLPVICIQIFRPNSIRHLYSLFLCLQAFAITADPLPSDVCSQSCSHTFISTCLPKAHTPSGRRQIFPPKKKGGVFGLLRLESAIGVISIADMPSTIRHGHAQLADADCLASLDQIVAADQGAIICSP